MFSTDLDAKTAAKAALLVGQELDLQKVGRGEPGVSFLARRYGPDVWYGDINSCCDIRRQIAKFHLTVNLPGKVSKQQKLQEKALSFALTDKNTPLIGEFVTRALEVFPLPKEKFKNELRIWGVEMDADRQYPNEPAAWMDDIVAAELPDFDLDRFRDWIRNSDSGTILDPPRFAEPLPPNPKPGDVAIDGDIVSTDDKGSVGPAAATNQDRPDGKPHFRPRKPKDQRISRKIKPTTRK